MLDFKNENAPTEFGWGMGRGKSMVVVKQPLSPMSAPAFAYG
jgi:hypothetical protein